jgi:uncharacterized protein (DUF302 family)
VLVTRSALGYADTVSRLIEGITSRGLTVFGQIDHAAAASEVGLELAAEVVVLFGNPRAGTPLMQSDGSGDVTTVQRGSFVFVLAQKV